MTELWDSAIICINNLGLVNHNEKVILWLFEIRFCNLTTKEKVNMKEEHGTQVVEVIAGRKIVLSAGIGQTNLEDLQWLMDTVLKHAAAWKATGWAYIADCTKMSPIGPKESGQLVKMTKAFVDAGCKAFGFAEGTSIMLKIQAKKNTQMSETGVMEGHFATVDEVLAWLQEDMKI